MSLRHTNTKENTDRAFDPDLWHKLQPVILVIFLNF